MAVHRGSRARFGRALGVAAVVAVLAVVGTSCEPAPPPGTSHSPSGSLDRIRFETRRDGGPSCETERVVVIEGWASDWDTLAPIEVMFYVIPPWPFEELAFWLDTDLGTAFPVDFFPFLPPESGDYTRTANVRRADVDAAFHRGANFGYRQEVRVSEGGYIQGFRPGTRTTICVAALNVGPGDNTLLGCKTV